MGAEFRGRLGDGGGEGARGTRQQSAGSRGGTTGCVFCPVQFYIPLASQVHCVVPTRHPDYGRTSANFSPPHLVTLPLDSGHSLTDRFYSVPTKFYPLRDARRRIKLDRVRNTTRRNGRQGWRSPTHGSGWGVVHWAASGRKRVEVEHRGRSSRLLEELGVRT